MRPDLLAIVLVISLSACVERTAHQLPALGEHRAQLVLAHRAETQETRLIAAEEEIADLSIWTGDAEVELTVLLFDETLAELGLSPGSYLPTTDGRELPYPRAEAQLGARLENGDLSSWTQLSERPGWLADLKFPGEEPEYRCVPAVRGKRDRSREFCFEDRVVYPELNLGSVDSGAGVTCEGDDAYLYFFTSRFDRVPTPDPNNPFDEQSTHVKMRMRSLAELEPELVRVDASRVGPHGAVSPAQLRHDGLELFFSSDRTDHRWENADLFSISRKSALDPWEPAQRISSLTPIETFGDNVGWPVLLGDDRTLLFYDAPGQTYRVARRATTTPGDINFERLDVTLDFEDLFTIIGGPSMSCDGWHLLYHRVEPDGVRRPRVVPIESYDPLIFGVPRDLDINADPGADWRNGFMGTFEMPDCSGLIVSDWRHVYWAEAKTCSR